VFVLAGGLLLGAVTGAFAVTTQRRRRAMREVERYFTLSPEIVILAGFDGYWKRVNPTVEAVLGYTEREALARPFMEFVHPDDRERTEEEARRVVAGTTARAFENRIVCKDGSYKWIEWTVTPFPEDRVMFGVGRDVTARRRSESEQAALRRLATLVAHEAPQTEVFGAIAEEIGRLLGTEEIRMLRFDGESSVVVVGSSGRRDAFPLGSRHQLEGDSVAPRVLRTGRATRIDNYTEAVGPLAETVRSLGIQAVVGAPILVEGRLWGAIITGSTGNASLPADTEARLLHFTELMATAVANAQARETLQRLADEQAALRRVATLVAQGVPPPELFSAVTTELAQVFPGLGPPLIATVIRFDPGPECVLVGASRPYELEPIGSRWAPKDLYVSTRVLRTGRSARVDDVDLQSLDGPDAEVLRLRRFLHQVGSPVIVEGRLWGAMTLNSKEAPPPDTDERLESFTELVATAIANAESREALARLADEQAALRRVATLVAQQPSPSEVFTAVTRAVGLLLGADLAVLLVFPGDGTATTIGTWSCDGGPSPPIGSRFPLDADSVTPRIFEAGIPARIDSYAEAKGEAADLARSLRMRSSVGAPILVEGKLWGALTAATRAVEPWAENAESRLAAFTELLATAIANAESREALARLADEQAALRRVATLVAQGASPQDLFEAVAEEVGRLLPVGSATMGRFEPDDSVTTLASWSTTEAAFPAGRRWPTEGTNVAWIVLQTGRSARLDDFSAATDPIGVTAREAGIKSAVGSPVIVKGRLWGVMTATSTEGPMPPDTEARLSSFTELVATAIANAEGKSELAASRRRIVAASDETRRRIERNLHDGTQQRLVTLGLAVRAAEANLPPERDDLRAQLSGVATGLVAAVEDLQEISRGIHPAILSRGGLGPALRALGHRSVIPVDLDVTTGVRVAEPIEVAAYYIASEALANAAKHSQASRIDVSLMQHDQSLVLSVRDDGVGGADTARGSGLVGLLDRVEALGGSIRVDSRPGKGTQITAELPLELESLRSAGPKDSR
jgi:PAS domain S-box-containing protein